MFACVLCCFEFVLIVDICHFLIVLRFTIRVSFTPVLGLFACLIGFDCG